MEQSSSSGNKIDNRFIFGFLGLMVGLAAVGFGVTGNLSTPRPVTVRPTPIPTTPTPTRPPAESLDSTQKQGLFALSTPTLTPTPVVDPNTPPEPSLCSAANLAFDDEGASNSESNIFIALDPPVGQTVGATGVIRAWVSDEAGGGIASSTTADGNGFITKHSDPTIDKDSNGYPWDPAIYITKLSTANQPGPYSGDKENGGVPKLLTAVKGKVAQQNDGPWISIPAHTDPTLYKIGTRVGDGEHVAEFIWHVSSLGLTPGTYRVQVAVHDGDEHLAVECTTINI